MEITVSGKHIEITPSIRQYAEEKVAKLPRYYDRVQEIDVIVDKGDNRQQEVEIIVKVEHADPFVVKVKGPDLYACIDDAVNKAERQLSEHKDKVRNRKHNV